MRLKSSVRSKALGFILVGLSACAQVQGPANNDVAKQSAGVEAPSRLFLQQLDHDSVIVKWRGAEGSVCLADSPTKLKKRFRRQCQKGVATEANHFEASLEGLKPNQRYYYSVAGARDEAQQFSTAPFGNEQPADNNTHIWIVGDSGTVTEKKYGTGQPSHPGEAKAVMDGFLRYNEAGDKEPLDLLLMLGDNAYPTGTDEQWQKAAFELYAPLLKQAAIWPTIGNHEMGAGIVDICMWKKMPLCQKGPVMAQMPGASASADPMAYDGSLDSKPDDGGMPYLSIFSLPTKGESGGVPSGTEQYYSFDYGNLHIVSLDSQLAMRDASQQASMRDWLVMDLEANQRDWTIVIFHHPPYSKGANHDSDEAEHSKFDRPQFDARTVFTPIFEAHGVDLVFSGHAHSYERSYYLNGHRGVSSSYSHVKHAEMRDGKPLRGNEDGFYTQLSPSSGNVDDRVIYTVAGSSGKANHNSGGTAPAVWLMHPAHLSFDPISEGAADAGETDGSKNLLARRHGLAVKGSVVVDVSRNKLTAKFIGVDGDVLDWYTITR